MRPDAAICVPLRTRQTEPPDAHSFRALFCSRQGPSCILRRSIVQFYCSVRVRTQQLNHAELPGPPGDSSRRLLCAGSGETVDTFLAAAEQDSAACRYSLMTWGNRANGRKHS